MRVPGPITAVERRRADYMRAAQAFMVASRLATADFSAGNEHNRVCR